MEKRIELERRGRKVDHISELNLDNCRSTSIVGLTEYTSLETLSLINVGLTTLKGFPKLPNLRNLELSDNRISNGLNYLTTSPMLMHLNLSGNKINDFESLKPLKDLPNLAVLDLFNNDATQEENYREKIFKMIPSLHFLDGLDCNNEEAESEGDDNEEDNESEDEEESGSEETVEVFELSEVYNDNLEEDNSDWEEGEAGNNDDEDEDSDIDDTDGEANNESTASVNANEVDAEKPEEESARGKKRKHDG